MPATVTDKSGNGVTGTPNGGVTFDSTWKAFSFDGVDDYIRGTIPGVADDYIHSISLWIKLTGTNGTIFEISGATRSANSVIGLYIDSDGTLAYYFYNNDARYNTNLQIGEWYHIGLTYHGSGERRVYVNGSQPSFKTSYGTLTNPLTLTGGTLTIGNIINLGATYYNGSIANFRLFNRALTADEIWQLYAYQKEYFQVSPDVVTFKGGRLGIGTSEPRAVLDVNGDLYAHGSVVQVVNTIKTDTYASNGTSPASLTGLNVSIQPKFSDSKILVSYVIPVGGFGQVFFRVKRTQSGNTTYIGLGDAASTRVRCTSSVGFLNDSTGYITTKTCAFEYLDDASSTSTITYQVETWVAANAYTLKINRTEKDEDNVYYGRQSCTITAKEICQ